MWSKPGGIMLSVSVKRNGYPVSTLDHMRKSGGYSVQDPRLTELGAIAKDGTIISALSPNVMVTLLMMNEPSDEKMPLDLAIQVMQYAQT